MANKFPPGSEVNTAWFVSNCNQTIGAIRRMEFGRSLVDLGLKLHAEGKCFDNSTPKKFGLNYKGYKFPSDKLKFYLAFENAYHCKDYISEKFWRNAFLNQAIPVQ